MTTTSRKPFHALPAVVIGATLMTITCSAAWAHPMWPGERTEACTGRHDESINDRLDRAAQQLEIKASQQAAWEAYAKAYKTLADQPTKKPDRDADAATTARDRAERVTELARKLTGIADATAKLQAVLSEDQKKILNRITRHSHHERHDWRGHDDEGCPAGQSGEKSESDKRQP